MKELTVKIHSIVDVITNSSTVIFTMAGPGSIKTTKELIDSLLAIGGSDLIADDLFEFSLFCEREEEEKGEILYNYCDDIIKLNTEKSNILNEKFGCTYLHKVDNKNKDAFTVLKNEYDNKLSILEKEHLENPSPELQEKFDAIMDDYEFQADIDMNIQVKDGITDKNALRAGKILNNLNSLFDTEASYDG